MAWPTIDSYSNELASVQPPLYAPLQPNELHGRKRIAFFTKTFASEAAGEDVALCVIPKGARIIGGAISFSATTATAQISCGLKGKDNSGYIDAALSVADDVDAVLAAAAITTTPKVALANSQALFYGYETEKELYLTLTTSVAGMGTQVLKGHIEYVVD